MLKLLLNPGVLLALLLAALVSSGSGFYFGWKMKGNSVDAQLLRDEQLLAKYEKLTAERIAGIVVQHRTVQTKAKETIREVPVYRDCRHDPGVKRLLDDALANRPVSADSVLPAALSPE